MLIQADVSQYSSLLNKATSEEEEKRGVGGIQKDSWEQGMGKTEMRQRIWVGVGEEEYGKKTGKRERSPSSRRTENQQVPSESWSGRLIGGRLPVITGL